MSEEGDKGTPAIVDLEKMPSITVKKLNSLKGKARASTIVGFCNECGRADSVGIFCCPVLGDSNKGLGNFTRCAVWFEKGIVRRVLK